MNMGADGNIRDMNGGVVCKAVLPGEGIGSDIVKPDGGSDMSLSLIYWMFENHGRIINICSRPSPKFNPSPPIIKKTNRSINAAIFNFCSSLLQRKREIPRFLIFQASVTGVWKGGAVVPTIIGLLQRLTICIWIYTGKFEALYNNQRTVKMRSSKNWLPEEDKALIELHLTRGFRSWARINQFLVRQFKILNKTPKLCRERFINHLNPAINRDDWTPQEETALIDLQAQLGNRWAEISRRLPGRTDNSVKNKFFSKYRHALKNLNLLLEQNQQYRNKMVKIALVYKLINFLGCKGQLLSPDEARLIRNAECIKNGIISFEQMDIKAIYNQQTFNKKIEELMNRIQVFSSSIKRKANKKKIWIDSKAESEIIESEEELPLHTCNQQSGPLHQKAESPNKKQSQSEPLTTIPNIYLQQLPTRRPDTEYLFRGICVQNEDPFWNLQPYEGLQFYMQEEH